MARMIAEPRTVTMPRPVVKRTAPVARPVVTPSVQQTVLGDRIAGARPRTRVVRKENRAVGREMGVVLVASFIVSLLCFYVSAYARVTAEGYEIARLTRKLSAEEAREQSLKAAIASRTALETINNEATAMGMIPGQTTNVNLVTPKSAQPTPAAPIVSATPESSVPAAFRTPQAATQEPIVKEIDPAPTKSAAQQHESDSTP